MIYQLVNKRTEILPLATSHAAISHLCTQFYHVCALLISKQRFESINSYQNKFKIKLFLQKNTNFLCARVSAPRPSKQLLSPL